MSSFGALEDEDINMMIKEMVVGLSDYGDNNAEKFLQNTAQIDDQLRQYTLIKTIKESIESDLGGMIYKCEDKNMTEKEAVEKILQSNSFKKLESNIKTRVKDLAHQLKFNLNTEFPLSKTSERLILEDEDDENHDDATTIHEDDGGGVGSGDHNWSSLMGVSSKCADGQFCSYSSPMFLTTESSQQILDNLHPANSVQTRYSALHNLSKSVSLSDLPFSPQWTSLKAYLVDILSVFNGVLWLPAARIVAKGMGRSKEMVEVVLLVLSRHFRMRCDEEKKKVGADEVAEGSVNNARERIVEVSGDACLVVPISLLKALRLLAQFQHTLPLKHSEKVNSRILNSILGILSSNGIASKPSQSISKIAINNGNFNVSSHNFNENVDNLDNLISYSTFTTPFSLFSLVDPDLSWFIKSMHHTSSKCIILDYLKKDNYILKAILRVIIGCCDVEMDQLQEDFNAKCSIFRGGDDTGGESGGNNALTEFDIGDINYDEDSIEDNISKNQRLEKNKVDDSETIDNNLEKKIKLTTIKSLLIRQSIIMLEKVVKSRVGRRLFPVGLVKDKHTVSLENLMVFLVKVWTSSKMVALKNCVGRCLEGWFKSADDKRQYGVLRKVFVFSEVPVLRREGLEVILKKLFLFDVLLSREEEEEEEEEEEDEKTFNEAYNFLMKLSCLPFSFSMWHYYSRLMSLRGLSTTESTSLHDITKHINARSTPIQAIIHQHLHQHLATHPTLYNSLKMGGLVADRLFDSWKEQCYLGVLDWSFVLKNLLVGVVYGASASISFFVSLLLHVEDDIKTRIHSSASSSSQPTSLSFIQISSSATTTPSITTLFHNTTIFADFKPHSSTFSHNHLLNQLIQEIFEKLMT